MKYCVCKCMVCYSTRYQYSCTRTRYQVLIYLAGIIRELFNLVLPGGTSTYTREGTCVCTQVWYVHIHFTGTVATLTFSAMQTAHTDTHTVYIIYT